MSYPWYACRKAWMSILSIPSIAFQTLLISQDLSLATGRLKLRS
jgi:hypothetical protein